jgi:alkylated DNA repair dioxygenase AlkB
MKVLPIPDAEIYYDPHFLPPEEAAQLFSALLSKCAWERRRSSFGHTVPRDEAYYGDQGTHYTYSRREYKPLPWMPELLVLKTRVEESTPVAAYANLSPCRGLATTPRSAISIGTEMTALGSTPMPS